MRDFEELSRCLEEIFHVTDPPKQLVASKIHNLETEILHNDVRFKYSFRIQDMARGNADEVKIQFVAQAPGLLQRGPEFLRSESQ